MEITYKEYNRSIGCFRDKVSKRVVKSQERWWSKQEKCPRHVSVPHLHPTGRASLNPQAHTEITLLKALQVGAYSY